jgi:3-oxoacyl-[acyl-carrier protein] reductase
MKSGRVVVVTGAGGGIGSKIVDRFLSNEDIVVGIDRSGPALDRLVSQRPGAKLYSFYGDVTKPAEVRAFTDFVKQNHDRVDVLVNCAGFFPTVPFEQMSLEQWREVIEINLTSQFQMTQAMLPLLKGRGWGRIVNITSASIFEGVVQQTHYVSAKAGIVGFSRSLAMEVGLYGITVNMVAPGLTLSEAVVKSMPDKLIKTQPELRALKRDECPQDLAGPVFLLASPDADFISGQLLVVDGRKVKN